jgi:stage V sporulation protein AE
MIYLNAFIGGGALCAIGQILIDKTKLTPARILVLFVVSGVVLSAVGAYEPFFKWAGAGASVPLVGFGHALAKGAKEAVQSKGLLGAFTGGLSATAGGITAAVVFGYMAALLSPARRR